MVLARVGPAIWQAAASREVAHAIDTAVGGTTTGDKAASGLIRASGFAQDRIGQMRAKVCKAVILVNGATVTVMLTKRWVVPRCPVAHLPEHVPPTGGGVVASCESMTGRAIREGSITDLAKNFQDRVDTQVKDVAQQASKEIGQTSNEVRKVREEQGKTTTK